MLNMQNVKDIEITEGDVRTIHDKDSRLIWGRLAYDTKYAGDTEQDGTPTPDAPVAIQVVTGEQTVTVSDGVDSEDFTIRLGSLELCKIGDYQDYIYKSGDDWFVHKEVNKYVFDGDEIWDTTPYGTNSWVLNNVIYFNFDSSKIQIISNIATGIAHADRNTSTPNVMYSGQNITFNFRNTSFTTLSALQTATKDNYVYYAIATPTDTQITDATLISQLDAVHEWLTRYGYSSTVTGNLPIIINQTNL